MLHSAVRKQKEQLIPQAIAETSIPMQMTIARSVRCQGIGVHSGSPASLTLKPAPAGTGIVFIRTDLSSAIIAARWDMVTETTMCTRLTNTAGTSISTIEHVNAACAGLGITNAIIEVDGPEIPIMDGSSAVFVDMIVRAGIVKLGIPVPSIRILKTVEVTNGTSYARYTPHHEPLLTMSFNAGGRLGVKKPWTLAYSPDHDDFATLLADARTFGFYEDAQKLWAAGLAKGASLENTIVFNENGVMNEDGLRHEDELIRHKMLDAIGDLALANFRIIGHFDGYNSGHSLNNNLLRALFADSSAWCYENENNDIRSFSLTPIHLYSL